MGGNAFKEIKTRRYNNIEIKIIQNFVSEKLNRIGAKFWFPKDLGNKETHGDLDIYVVEQKKPIVWEHLFNIVDIKKRPNINHLVIQEFNDFQIDVIKVSPNQVNFKKVFENYGDMMYLIGKTCKQYNLKLTDRGLFYRYRTYKTNLIPLSINPEEICNILQLDYNHIKNIGFKNEEELFSFIKNWNIFKPYIFNTKNISNFEWKNHIRKRKALNEFVNSCDHLSEVQPRLSKFKDINIILPYLKKYENLIKNAKEKIDIKEAQVEQTRLNNKKNKPARKKFVDQLLKEGNNWEQIQEKLKKFKP